jgi:presenilin-like A22 family membrane protease
MGLFFVVANALALLLATPFREAGYQAFENPEDPINPLIYIVLILVFTGVILAVVKLKRESFVRYIILGAMAITMVYVFTLPFWYLLIYLQDPALFTVNSTTAQMGILTTLSWIAFGLSILLAGLLTYLLIRRPEWYVVDAVGISVAAGVIAILGISFGILPALLLLIFLAIYDAWAVYRTKHMITLADAVTSQRLPVLLVVPKSKDYSFLKQEGLKKEIESGKEREAMFMGLGDVIIPGILAVSAFTFLAPPGGLAPFGVTLGTIAGALVGYAVLMRFVAKGNPQAGLPLLNSGAIGGFLITYLLVFGDFRFGIF